MDRLYTDIKSIALPRPYGTEVSMEVDQYSECISINVNNASNPDQAREFIKVLGDAGYLMDGSPSEDHPRMIWRFEGPLGRVLLYLWFNADGEAACRFVPKKEMKEVTTYELECP
jgi:hypothetical protein